MPLQRIDFLNRISVILDFHRTGSMSTLQARSKLGVLVRRLTSHKYPINGRTFRIFWSNSAAINFPNVLNTDVDHAVPVACIVEDMLYTNSLPGATNISSWMSLEYGFYLVRVTKQEHSNLSKASMPLCWSETTPNAWKARYLSARIAVDWKEDNGALIQI